MQLAIDSHVHVVSYIAFILRREGETEVIETFFSGSYSSGCTSPQNPSDEIPKRNWKPKLRRRIGYVSVRDNPPNYPPPFDLDVFVDGKNIIDVIYLH